MLLNAVRATGALAGVLLVACDPPPCATPFIGDRKLPVEAVLIALAAGDTFSDIAPGATIALEPPPQGGYVTYVGARVRNLNSCKVAFEGRLREPSTSVELGFDRREANLLLDANGYGVPESPARASMPNVNPCPDYGPNDIHDRTLTLEVKITDPEGRSTLASTPVVPRCQLSDPGYQYNCTCTCSANYFLGKCNFGDGGNDLGGVD